MGDETRTPNSALLIDWTGDLAHRVIRFRPMAARSRWNTTLTSQLLQPAKDRGNPTSPSLSHTVHGGPVGGCSVVCVLLQVVRRSVRYLRPAAAFARAGCSCAISAAWRCSRLQRGGCVEIGCSQKTLLALTVYRAAKRLRRGAAGVVPAPDLILPVAPLESG